MKFYLLLLGFFCLFNVNGQVKDNNNRQIEQLQQLRQAVINKIDTIQAALPELAASIETTRRKIDQLRKEANNQDKPDMESKEQLSRLSVELAIAINMAETLQKKFDMHFAILDKALNLQKDLEDKINALLKETNR